VELAAQAARIRRLKDVSRGLEEDLRAYQEKEKRARAETARLREKVSQLTAVVDPAPPKPKVAFWGAPVYSCRHCGVAIPEGEDWCATAKANIASWRPAPAKPVRD